MNKIKRKWERLTDDEKKSAKDDLIFFFKEQRDEEIGIIAAEEIIDFFLQNVGSKLYNKGVIDAKIAIKNRFEELEIDTDELMDI